MSPTLDDLENFDIRTGEIVDVREFPRARLPSYKVLVTFGDELEPRWCSVVAKETYTPNELKGLQVLCVVNLPPKNIAGFMSQALVLGVPAVGGGISLLTPSREAVLGGQL